MCDPTHVLIAQNEQSLLSKVCHWLPIRTNIVESADSCRSVQFWLP